MRKTRSDKGIKRKVTFPELLDELKARDLISNDCYNQLSVNQIKKEKASSKCVSIWKPHTSISQEPKEEVFYDCQGYGPQKIVKKSSVANEPIKEAKP